MKTQFKVGDNVRLKNNHSYTGVVTKTKYVPQKGLNSGDFQWLYLDGNSNPAGSTSEAFELIPEKSDREKAIEWFSKLSSLRKTQLSDTHTELVGVGRRWETLTGREIEQIWRKETQQLNILEFGTKEFNAMCATLFSGNLKEEKQKVDFEMLSSNLMYITEHCKNSSLDKLRAREITKNLLLFFDLLSKSSTFAHKAHKELNKLMK